MIDVHPESVRVIAKKDFQDAVRSWLFWGLSGFFFALLAVITGITWYFAGEPILAEELTTEILISLVSNVTRLVIPVIALILGWKAIAGERESGSMKVLLALPHSRADVVLGKLLGRSLVLALSLVLGFGLAAIVVAGFMGRFGILDYLGLLAMSIIYGVAYVSIAVAISALTRSTTFAGAGVFGVFVLFYVVWNALMPAFRLLVSFGYIEGVSYTLEANGQDLVFQRPPAWAFAIDMFDPGNAYANVLTLATSAAEIEGASDLTAAQFGGSVPFFLQDWFAFVVLLFWIVVPLGIALHRFEQVDL